MVFVLVKEEKKKKKKELKVKRSVVLKIVKLIDV